MKNNTPNINNARMRRSKPQILKNVFKINNELKTIGLNKKYFIRTYGCQSNTRDSEIISGILEMMGYTKTNDPVNSDILILNTCAIRENAELKVFGEIGFLKQISDANPNFLFGVCGCMAQEESVVKKIIDKISHINFVFGTHNIYELPHIIDEAIKTKTQVIKVYSKEGDIIEELPTTRDSKIKAFVNVMYGCDNFCTYCIVPYTRGKIRSRDKQDILNEIVDLKNKGYKEVTLLGQNVNSYGIDKNDGYKFANLLEDVCKTNIDRVRFTTSNPWNFSKDIVDLFGKYKNLMPYIHLPIQSGDEKILKEMNRTMKIKDYLETINYIKKNVPDCAITTDLIVGFPNETKSAFNNTIKLYKKVKFDNAYTFIYSKREGTPAAQYKDNVTKEIKQERLTILNELVRKYGKEKCLMWVGKTVSVLVEGKSKNNDNTWTGYSPQWKVVNFTGKTKPGEIVNVKITSASRFSLNGEKE